MHLIFGLGNIGAEYANTRHNIGFTIVEHIAREMNLAFEPGRGAWREARGSFKGKPFVLIKPETYMNRSGSAVSKALVTFKTSLDNCLICYDDLNLPPGKIRFRDAGSAGGHNGITDIIERTGTRRFPRLRFGIGNDFPRGRQVDYVLGPFDDTERQLIEESVALSAEGVLCFIRQGIVQTMNQFNSK
ncbi:MAG: aminoacyl-tRNA hydrolase [Candidatus Cyclonatronum sp.]|uniref:aminoacyl-tRNA hydrolase n=1 Tax=Cyclonatronum sp. TaxID=3024185 RepID=UPI0025BA5742|nr:aminoacyl-tRNA hydrolase [Cyclonatronum sp.]MCC5932662.1 aminoacyl-tRNA hydrolase [Balneolales bacterium]MCH8486046.1 aminoacyl-tRNA hydrolase [Cyclonatronum sp.]